MTDKTDFDQQTKTVLDWLRNSTDVESSAMRAFLVDWIAKLRHEAQEASKKMKGLRTRLTQIHGMVADYDGETIADRVENAISDIHTSIRCVSCDKPVRPTCISKDGWCITCLDEMLRAELEKGK